MNKNKVSELPNYAVARTKTKQVASNYCSRD